MDKMGAAIILQPENMDPALRRHLTSTSASTLPILDQCQTFVLFPEFPTEIRLKIWGYAIESPRILELIQSPNVAYEFSRINAPSTLLANKESYAETLAIYKNQNEKSQAGRTQADKKIGTEVFDKENSLFLEWMQEHDILHAKRISLLDLQSPFRPPTQTHRINRWENGHRVNLPNAADSDIWLGRPAGFEGVRSLAISRDILVHSHHDYEAVIRHFFPNLLVLIVLIDDEVDIETTWDLWDLKYDKYEALWKGEIPRLAFARNCAGPFKEVKNNQDYQLAIEYEMRKHFEQEQKDYAWYVAPRIQVMAAVLEEGVELEECGRFPAIPERDYWGRWPALPDTKRADPLGGCADVPSATSVLQLRSRRVKR